MDNATDKQQKEFWKKVVSSIKKMLKTNDKVWVSTHGKGVPYLHIRIDTNPKYYLTKKQCSPFVTKEVHNYYLHRRTTLPH